MGNKKKILAVFITAAMLLTQTTVAFAERMPAANTATVRAACIKAQNATYNNAPQTVGKASIENALKATAAAAINNNTVTVTIIWTSFTEPAAGNADNPSGINGSYKFRVRVAQNDYAVNTSEKTIAIIATPFTGLTNADAVAAAKAAVVDGSVSVVSGAIQEQKTAAVQSYVNGLLRTVPNAASVTAAVTYNSETNKYDIALSKSLSSESKSITMTVSELEDPDIAIVDTAKNVAEGAVYYNMIQAEATSEEVVANAVKATAEAAVNDGSVTVTVTKVWPGYVLPTAGDTDNPNGVNGRYGFSVTVSKGSQSRNTGWKYIDITATPYVGLSNVQVVTEAQTAANGACYNDMAQAAATDESAIVNTLKAMAEAAVNNSDVAVTINSVWPGYELPIAGDADNPDGVNGKYGFSVTVSKGSQSRNTGWKFIGITATSFTGLSNADAVAAAKAAIVDGTVSVAFGATQEQKTVTVQGYANGLLTGDAEGVLTVVSYDSGTDKYDVALSKGSRSGSKSLAMTVSEAEDPDIATVAAAFNAANGAAYKNMTPAEAVSEEVVANAVKATAEVAVNDSSVTVTVTKVWPGYVLPTAGDADKPNGTNGRYGFKVTVSKGLQSWNTGWKYIDLTAPPFTGLSYADAVAAAIDVINDDTVSVAYGATQEQKTAAVQSYVNSQLTGDAEGVQTVVSYDSGTDKYDVALFKGSTSESKRITMTVSEAAEPDIATVAAAFNAVDCASYKNMTPEEATSEEAAENAVEATAEEAVDNSTVTVTVTKVWPGYELPTAGDADNPDGANGCYGFKVTVSKGSQSWNTGWKYIDLTATPFTGLSNADAVAAAKAAIVSGTVNVPFGASQSDKTAEVQSYVYNIISNTANAAGVTATVTHSSGNQYNVALSKGGASDSKTIAMTVNEAAAPDTTPPTISPISHNYDLSAPADVTTTITWNSTASVTDVVYSISPDTTVYTLNTGDYIVSDDDLTIKNSFLSGLALTTGTVLEFDITFNTGAIATLKVNVENGYTPSDDADLSSLSVNGMPVNSFDPDDTEYDVELPYGASSATVTATASDSNAQVIITQVSSPPGEATVTVTAEDGITTKTYTIHLTIGAAPVTSYTVTASAGSGGSISPSGAVNVTSGGSQTFTISPNSGYRINTVTVDGVSQGAISTYTFTNVTADHTINAAFTRTSSGRDTHSTPSTPEYKADVDAGSGSDTTLSVTVDKNSGSATVDVGTGGNFKSGGKTTVVTVPSVPDVDTYTLGVPVPNLTTLDEQGEIAFNTDNGSVIVPLNMLAGVEGISGSKAQISIGQGDKSNLPESTKEAIGNRPLIQLTMSIDAKQTEWNNPDAPVTISVPYTPTASELVNPEAIVIWYIDGNGNAISVPNGHYDAASGTVTFTTTHFSFYAVGYSKVSFKDVAEKAWYSDAVSFIAARGITNGTGNGNYTPGAKLTRGQFIVMVMKTYGMTADTDVSDNFTDAGNTYYTSYLAEAKRLGITAGVGGNRFAPDKEITRQEMFTLLYNALKSIDKLPEGNSGNTLSAFSDAGQIATWATDAMTLMVETGTVSGSGGKLSPTGSTTRAEMAQVLYNLL